MINQRETDARKKNAYFAVTSLGKGRWYWVVWPSLQECRSSEEPIACIADGCEGSKVEAVDRALEVAGMGGIGVAAKYAEQFYRSQSRRKRASAAGQGGSAPALKEIEFLYRDIQDEITKRWYSVPHRVVRKTRKYVYVEQRRFDPERLTGTWLDYDVPTFRLSRERLEREGYDLVSVTADVDDPLFFTVPYQERAKLRGYLPTDCFSQLGLSPSCSISDVKAAYRRLAKSAHPDHGGSHEQFLALQAAYEEALRLCRYIATDEDE